MYLQLLYYFQFCSVILQINVNLLFFLLNVHVTVATDHIEVKKYWYMILLYVYK